MRVNALSKPIFSASSVELRFCSFLSNSPEAITWRFQPSVVFAAFHFNSAIAPALLKKLNLPEYKFLTGKGPQSGMIYYNLADEIIFNHLIEDGLSPEEEATAFRKMIGELAYVVKLFIQSARSLIEEVLIEKGWQVRETPSV